MPGYDIVVTADPSTIKDTAEDIDKLLKLASAPPPLRRFIARGLNVPLSLVEQLERDEAQFAEQQAAQMVSQVGGAGLNAGAAPAGPGLPPAIAQRMGGPQGPGGNGRSF